MKPRRWKWSTIGQDAAVLGTLFGPLLAVLGFAYFREGWESVWWSLRGILALIIGGLLVAVVMTLLDW